MFIVVTCREIFSLSAIQAANIHFVDPEICLIAIFIERELVGFDIRNSIGWFKFDLNCRWINFHRFY